MPDRMPAGAAPTGIDSASLTSSDVDVAGHAHEVGYATWIRTAADTIDRPELPAEQLDKAGALPPGERADGLGRADAGDDE